jgi:hypothetical protein
MQLYIELCPTCILNIYMYMIRFGKTLQMGSTSNSHNARCLYLRSNFVKSPDLTYPSTVTDSHLWRLIMRYKGETTFI